MERIFAVIKMKVDSRPYVSAMILTSISIISILVYISGIEKKMMSDYQPVNVVQAAKDIKINSIIKAEDLKIGTYPKRFLFSDNYSDITAISGKRARVNIASGQPIIKNIIMDFDARDGVSDLINEEKRGYVLTLKNKQSLSYISPGDLVDVLTTLSLDNGREKKRATATIVQNIPVISVNNLNIHSILSDESDAKTQAFFSGGHFTKNESEPSIVLEVSPVQAQKIAFATSNGEIALVIRGAYGSGRVEKVDAITANSVIGDYDSLIHINKEFREYRGK